MDTALVFYILQMYTEIFPENYSVENSAILSPKYNNNIMLARLPNIFTEIMYTTFRPIVQLFLQLFLGPHKKRETAIALVV